MIDIMVANRRGRIEVTVYRLIDARFAFTVKITEGAETMTYQLNLRDHPAAEFLAQLHAALDVNKTVAFYMLGKEA